MSSHNRQFSISVAQAAQELGLSPRTLQNRISRHRNHQEPRGPVPPYVTTGARCTVIPLASFREFLDKLTAAGYIPETPRPARGRGRPTKVQQLAGR